MAITSVLFGASLMFALGAAIAGAAGAALVRIDFEGANSSPGAQDVWGTGTVRQLSGYLIYES
ncbi:MAG: hypothetical protein MUD07_00355 [Burkholderiaceae bacterium]|nr:hypothetical protein [Burkholderiaceae bacterium]